LDKIADKQTIATKWNNW